MDQLRRRVPFQSHDENPVEEESEFLDEEQQEALIAQLREQDSKANEIYSKILYGFLATFTLLFMLSFVNETAKTMPHPIIFTCLGLLVHLNLCLRLSPHLTRQLLGTHSQSDLLPLSYRTSYLLALVAPALCFFVNDDDGLSWATVGWWCIPLLAVFVTHTISDAMEEGNHSLTELDASRYSATGA